MRCGAWAAGRRGQGRTQCKRGEERSGWQTHHQWASTDRRESCFLTRDVSLKAPHQLPRAHSLRTESVETGSVSIQGFSGGWHMIWLHVGFYSGSIYTAPIVYLGSLGGIGTKWKQVPWAWVSKRRSDTHNEEKNKQRKESAQAFYCLDLCASLNSTFYWLCGLRQVI